MEINNQINKKSQQLAKLERQLALEKIKQCKAETRRKIERGGLVVKAQMDKYSKDIILGALIHAVKKLSEESRGQRCSIQEMLKKESIHK